MEKYQIKLVVTPTGEICANEIRRFCCYKFANQIIACLTERNVATKMNQRGDKKTKATTKTTCR